MENINKTKLSVALAIYNEEKNLDRCLKAIKHIADEIIIVDGHSQDDSKKIANTYNAKIISASNKANFHINKNIAIKACSNQWILLLDADEVVSKKLAIEIKKIITLSEDALRARDLDPKKKRLFLMHQKNIEQRDGAFNQKSQETTAFFIPRKNIFLGKPLRYGGVYPDGVIRLFKKNKASLPAKNVHEQFKVEGRVDWLENDLIHYDTPIFSRYLLRANRYTTLTALGLQQADLKISIANTFRYFILKPISSFIAIFLRHKGFLDGVNGFVWALFSALHHPIAYMKYWEMENSKK